MIEIKQVDIECIDVFWDEVKNWIYKVVVQSNGRHTLDSTYKLLKQGTMIMFLVMDKKKLCAVYVVEKIYYPAKLILGILFCGGSKVIKEVKKIEKFFLNYAKEQKCDGLEIIGRKGWDRIIKNNNLKFKKTGFFYEVAT
tara:strand:- start:902 stop:1321 length:420 start_codon:yes stop_codon:yes gene_type:complete